MSLLSKPPTRRTVLSMTRADLEAAAKEKYPYSRPFTDSATFASAQRAAYIRGRLDQAEADARIAESIHAYRGSVEQWAAREIAAAIEKGVQ